MKTDITLTKSEIYEILTRALELRIPGAVVEKVTIVGTRLRPSDESITGVVVSVEFPLVTQPAR